MTSQLLTTLRWHLLRGGLPWQQEVTDAALELIGEKLGFAPPDAPDKPIAPLPEFGSKQLVALCLGHGRDGDEGNVGAGGVSEEDFNLPVLHAVAHFLRDEGVKVVTITHYQGNGYTAAMNWLAEELKRLGATAAIEFHFNAFNKQAHGHEACYWHKSTRGVKLAEFINGGFSKCLPSITDRGLKPKTIRDRGSLFLSRPHCPCAIAEPFFGDNPQEWAKMSRADSIEHLISGYGAGILDYLSWERQQAAV